MNRKAVRTMFLGTCRIHDPVKTLQGAAGLLARATPHRFHTTGQTLSFINHMTGAVPYRPETMHLVSDYAAGQILAKGRPRAELLDEMESLRSLWSTFVVFVIEICAQREFIADLDGVPHVVNTFTQRDQTRYAAEIARQAAAGQSVPELAITARRQTAGDILRGMRAIKTALGDRPVVWVSHMRPGGDEARFATVNAVRHLGASTLCDGALSLGDRFLDPSDVAAEMGRPAFFLKDGEDLDHMTDAAAQRLGQIYRGMATALAPPSRFPRPPAAKAGSGTGTGAATGTDTAPAAPPAEHSFSSPA